MAQFDPRERKTMLEAWRGSLAMFCFGLTILAYLVAIERPQWFSLRPVSGAAMAMSLAGDEAGQRQGYTP